MKEKEFQALKSFAYHYAELQKIAKSLQRLHETACNYGLTERQEKRAGRLIKKAQEIAQRFGLEVYEQGDPRGCPLYLIKKEMKEKGCIQYIEGIAIVW